MWVVCNISRECHTPTFLCHHYHIHLSVSSQTHTHTPQAPHTEIVRDMWIRGLTREWILMVTNTKIYLYNTHSKKYFHLYIVWFEDYENWWAIVVVVVVVLIVITFGYHYRDVAKSCAVWGGGGFVCFCCFLTHSIPSYIVVTYYIFVVRIRRVVCKMSVWEFEVDLALDRIKLFI